MSPAQYFPRSPARIKDKRPNKVGKLCIYKRHNDDRHSRTVSVSPPQRKYQPISVLCIAVWESEIRHLSLRKFPSEKYGRQRRGQQFRPTVRKRHVVRRGRLGKSQSCCCMRKKEHVGTNSRKILDFPEKNFS